ncbi:DEAD/DEAH box helicase family protein [Porphyromonas levii]|uniref:Uncharacterized protein n=1 Tax=Porphyromonas levii TaxID=28114 RepID=A0A4Y8WNE3_9PORP|nr:hypothetical protein [Porphyromonas levii]TFH94330.1 hypothetical protein E4P47_07960 [Porphyromonas levii]TFH95250.1 hypothetical protein E4P48_08425 [Porphyromonas levii]
MAQDFLKIEGIPTGDVEPSIDTNQLGEVKKEVPKRGSKKSIQGLMVEEANDPNKIKVTIADKKTPIVILFGPPSAGKTMMLVRMTKWLYKNGYKVEPQRHFRNAEDAAYQSLCDNFNSLVSSPNAAEATNVISFMLLKVSDAQGNPLCQILEAPGEHYFDEDYPENDFPRYINEIVNGSNSKIWLILTEPNWRNQNNRDAYVNRVRSLTTRSRSKDKFIIVLNKVDNTPFAYGVAKVNNKAARGMIESEYEALFTIFKNTHPITSLWRSSYADFISFQSGSFPKDNDGNVTYQIGPDEYVSRLWKLILKKLRG